MTTPSRSRTGVTKSEPQNSSPFFRTKRIVGSVSSADVLSASSGVPLASSIRMLNDRPTRSSRSYPVRASKLSLAKTMGSPATFAFVKTMGIRVVSAAITNGPKALRKLSMSASAICCCAGSGSGVSVTMAEELPSQISRERCWRLSLRVSLTDCPDAQGPRRAGNNERSFLRNCVWPTPFRWPGSNLMHGGFGGDG